MTSLCIAHLSDVHFGNPCYNLTQFLSKRWIGNLNFLLFRRRAFQSNHLCLLPQLFEQLNVERICVTGDFTTTALKEEFQLAQKFLKLFSQPYFALPGNHDAYTKKAEKEQLYYKYFSHDEGDFGLSLKRDRVFCTQIKKGWYWISLDCAIATPPFQAYGLFTDEMGIKLDDILSQLPQHAHVIMGNHFPLFATKNTQHNLKNGELLRTIVKAHHPKIRLYLHGHIHKPYIINKMHEGYPLVLNSGCSAYVENGGFYLIQMDKNNCHVDHYFYRDTKGWVVEKSYLY